MEYLGNQKPVNKIKPEVSVCIQTFQHAKFIGICLESIVKQETSFPFEILIGEDCSTDGTREICVEYAEKYPDLIRLFLREPSSKITIEDKKSGRANYLQNFKDARGKYIAVVDGDDYFLNLKKLQIQYDIMEANPECIITGSDTIYTYDGDPPLPFTSTYDTSIIKKINKYSGVLHYGPSSSRLFRNDITTLLNSKAILKTRVFDMPLLHYLLNKGEFWITKENLVAYRIHSGGHNSGNKNIIAKSNFSHVFRYLYEEKLIGYTQYRVHLAKNYLRMGYIILKNLKK
ncbi:glycosyltransferase family 2 protein [Algoriphagus hitonicola]|uniref:Glycosyltransferase involved in cell wall bisynthesis n=1 Tax=Algoriphagus hitonicola TaxID=435880 RepID=A0A1I2X5R5_9BACT|nr:glycosyltransferase family 2 protein [Algoriphagus hitonicola]SFH08026.1 Glycosyltransferase involved in cell wall bisynthesis [Algoriphagus hitonicola]